MSDPAPLNMYGALKRFMHRIIVGPSLPQQQLGAYLWLTDNAPTPAHIPCVVVAEEDENHDEFYTVQVMTVPNQSGSFVTETIRPGHALYNFFLERVGALNMAGDFEEIEGIGENLSRKHYNVYINAEQHASICSLGTTEQL